MGRIRSFRDLDVWQRAMGICVTIYQLTDSFPKAEIYGLTSQLRRAAVSVASNIAEGHARPRLDFARFVQIAYGSLNEIETQLELSKRLGYLSEDGCNNLFSEIAILGRQLNALKRKLREPGID